MVVIAVAGLLGLSALTYISVFASRRIMDRGRRTRAPWGAPEAFGVFFLFLGMNLASPVVVAAVFLRLGYPTGPAAQQLSVLLTYMFNLITVAVMFRVAARNGRPWRALGFNGTPLSRSAAAGATVFLLYLPLSFVWAAAVNIVLKYVFNVELSEQEVVKLFRGSSDTLLVMLLFAGIVLAPILEELVFRGFIQRGLENTLGKRHSVIMTALLFSLVHGKQASIIILPLSLVLSITYAYRRNIVVNFFIHGLFNATGMLLVLLSRVQGGVDV